MTREQYDFYTAQIPAQVAHDLAAWRLTDDEDIPSSDWLIAQGHQSIHTLTHEDGLDEEDHHSLYQRYISEFHGLLARERGGQ